ncbi:MAG TPA: mannose-1-phosphate guanylyltransferase [Candidatus Saccharimonadales bacterium]|nr:mannose-1-phosphate guanylyltransferase [Candidatus Saccharimonadales bacterium]
MIAVINAGGSGTRLWPLSTPEYPKHLLKLTGSDSLLQDAYRRAKKIAKHVYIVTEGSHAHHVKEQLPELTDENFIIEAGRRGTAGCLIAGLQYVKTRHDNDEPIAFLHADHVIHDVEGFAYSFKVAGEVSKERDQVTLIGIEPAYASTAFGYIQKGESLHKDGLAYEVAGFKEKPDFKTAQSYIRSGRYLWNCGYFVGSVNTFARALKKFSPEWYGYYEKLLAANTEEQYKKTYLSFKNDAIDYALLELDDELQVVPANFDWMDVGSFNDVHGAVETDEKGNYVHGKVETDMVENSYIRNDEPNKPVGVIGLDNVVVINSPNGILVARKDLAQNVKEIAKKFQDEKK